MRVKSPGFLREQARKLVHKIVEKTKNVQVDIPKETLEIMQSNTRKIYSGLHKSMWETIGIPTIIDSNNAQIPYIVVAKTLVGPTFRPIAEHLGIVFVDSQNIRKGSEDMNNKIPLVLKKYDTLIFPEGTRTNTGFTKEFSASIFNIATNYSKEEELYLIPLNCDYYIVNDAKSRIESSKKYKFMAHHLMEWFSDLDTIYVSFGEPIRVRDFNDRKELKRYTQKKSEELIKILPINIYAKAIKSLGPEFKEDQLIEKMRHIITELEPHRHNFRGFTSIDDILKGLHLATGENQNLYNLYANYINRYYTQ